jgi:hypothetical protein
VLLSLYSLWETLVTTGTAHFIVSDCERGQLQAGASVSIDGVFSGITNAAGIYDVTGLSSGSHTYSISLALYQTGTGTFTIVAGQTTTISRCLVLVDVPQISHFIAGPGSLGVLTIVKCGAYFECSGPMISGTLRLQNPEAVIQSARSGNLRRLVTRIDFEA